MTIPEVFDRPDAAKEKPRLNPLREEMRQTLNTPGWQFIFTTGFAPQLREWRNALIWSTDLDMEDRVALQRAMAMMYEGFKNAYGKSGLEMPRWLRKEFEATSDE